MKKPVKIACIGEVMIELIASDNHLATLGIGGDTYNTAVYLAKLKPKSEIEVSYVTALGLDVYSSRVLENIKQYGISTSLIERRKNMMPGLYAIDTDENGERSFSYWRGQSAARTLFQDPCDVSLSRLSQFDLIYVSGISLAILPNETRNALIDFLAKFRTTGGKVAFDSNYRPRLWENIETAQNVITSMWETTDIALPSMDDEQLLFPGENEDEILQRLAAAGIRMGALKRGQSGPRIIGQENSTDISFDMISDVVDTTAAGDSFNAGFIGEVACGGDIITAARLGHQIASKVVQKPGAIVALD